MGKIGTIKWGIEPDCNLSCRHCAVSDVKPLTALPLKQNKLIAKKLIDCGTDRILFLAMEPLCHEGIFGLIKYCAGRGAITGIITNGTLLDADTVGKLLDSGLTFLAVSLEGMTAESNDFIRGKGSFQRVMDNIAVMQSVFEQRKQSFELALEMCLHAGNIREASGFVEFFNKLPFEIINLGSVELVGSAKENPEIRATIQEQEQAFAQIFQDFNQKGNGKYSIVPKTFMPYETSYYNVVYGLGLPFHVPSCSVINGNGSIAVSADGQMSACQLLEANVDVGGKMIRSDIGVLSDHTLMEAAEKIYRLTAGFVNPSHDFCERCGDCIHEKRCMVCPVGSDDMIRAAVEKCNDYRVGFTGMAEEICLMDRQFSFHQTSYLETGGEGDKMRMVRVFFDGSVNDNPLPSGTAGLLRELYGINQRIKPSAHSDQEGFLTLLAFLLREGYITTELGGV